VDLGTTPHATIKAARGLGACIRAGCAHPLLNGYLQGHKTGPYTHNDSPKQLTAAADIDGPVSGANNRSERAPAECQLSAGGAGPLPSSQLSPLRCRPIQLCRRMQLERAG
jgi:hypothetical protein